MDNSKMKSNKMMIQLDNIDFYLSIWLSWPIYIYLLALELEMIRNFQLLLQIFFSPSVVHPERILMFIVRGIQLVGTLVYF